MWYTEQVAKQLNEGRAPADAAVALNLSEIKPLHAKWIYEMYEYLRGRSDLVLNGFELAGITEAVEKSNEVFERIENSFLASRNDNNLKLLCSTTISKVHQKKHGNDKFCK